MTVYETEIPGVGRKFEVELDDGSRAVVLHHHDGRRELFRRPDPEADSEQVFDLPAETARRLAIIEWVDVPADSPLVGETIGEANVRAETGASVIAIQRGADTVANPATGVIVEPDDILVALGTRTEREALD